MELDRDGVAFATRRWSATSLAATHSNDKRELATAPAVLSLTPIRVQIVVGDALCAITASLLAAALHPGGFEAAGQQFLTVVEWLLPVSWVVTLALAGAYERRHLLIGADEFRRVFAAGAYVVALLSFASFIVRADISRSYVLLSIPTVTLLSAVWRYAMRKHIHRRLSGGAAVHRVLAVGQEHLVRSLVRHMGRTPYAGFRVVAAVTTAKAREGDQCSGEARTLVSEAKRLGADTIAIADASSVQPGELRALSWELEGTGLQLIVVPEMTDIAGPRVAVRPVAGLPLLYIDQPEFSGARRLVKSTIDRCGSAILIILLSPVLTACAAGVRLNTRGPSFYRQVRVGLNGTHFTMIKFRSMRIGSEIEREEIGSRNELGGALFKIREDYRVTGFGRFMRRWSLDELPQLFNVLTGSMSLVGPRPLPISDIEPLQGHVRRRQLVKPGMTGLWQVSGRADLPWEECVRLDLYYVENWSVTLDLMVLWKTVTAVVRARGAY